MGYRGLIHFHRHPSFPCRSHLAVQLRNKLMFFIDNMFMYLQVDVVESRFRALLTAIGSCEDFLVIQREHSLFQIMVLSHCFLLSSACSFNQTKSEKLQENEVLLNLERILSVVNVFAESQLEGDGDESVLETQVPGMNSLRGLCDQFDSLVGDFMLRLMGLKSGASDATAIGFRCFYWSIVSRRLINLSLQVPTGCH